MSETDDDDYVFHMMQRMFSPVASGAAVITLEQVDIARRKGGIRADEHVTEELGLRFGQENVAVKERK